MTKISRYIFSQLFSWAVLVTLTLTCVVWLTQSLRFVHLIVNHGLSAPLFVWLTGLLLPTFLLVILPIAAFCAVLFAYNKLITDSEMVVLRGAGLSQWALARPAILLAVLATLVCYFLSLYLLPTSFRQFKDLQREYRSSYSFVLLQEGVFNPVMKGVTVFVRERNRAGELRGIIVHDRRNPKRPVTMMAESGAIMSSDSGPRVLMQNGTRQEIRPPDGQIELLNFDQYIFEISEKKIAESQKFGRDPNEQYLSELLHPAAGRFSEGERIKFRVEAHYRLIAPLLSLAFVMVGVGFLLSGQFNRRGQWRRIVGAVGTVTALEAALIGIKNISVKSPDITVTMYLVVIVPVVLGLYSLRGRSRRTRPASNANDIVGNTG